jgi:NAD(P)-dependent dehydrogenase (short-subunit alcohol dehydrogenase family)|tara:strand:- start:8743 stop:9552 length:810 start_codon:yes stop_codon:yes gene_type:complete
MNISQINRSMKLKPALNRLEGRIAVISGGANGVGAAASRLFSNEGAAVVILDWDRASGEALQVELADTGADVRFIYADVSKPEDVATAIDLVITQHDHIDILFNHAGSIIVKPFLDYTIEDWDEMMNSNAKSAFLVTRAVLPGMLERGYGSIINTSSTAITVCSKMESVYIASKSAMHQLARAIAVEFRDSGVRCNNICPNFVRTKHGLEEMAQLRAFGVLASEDDVNTLQGRICEPEEVATVALFLASDESSFVNGAEIFVDNTFTAV